MEAQAEAALAFSRVVEAWCIGLRPDPQLTVSTWADQHRILSSRVASEPGQWRTARTPYLREIMDALSPSHPARRIVFMKGSQVGGTEAGTNWLGFIIHHAPGPVLVVQPTVELAKRYSRQRIDALIEDTPVVKERVQPAKQRDKANTMLAKDFPGGVLVMTGANSAVGLRSMPARYLFLDEVDAYPASAGEEGDPIALAEARTRTFSWRSKILLVSTPTLEGASRIAQEYDRTDKRRYFVPCPFCNHQQWLKWERMRWEPGRPETVAYICEGCGEPIDERFKGRMLDEGAWRSTAESADPHTVGYHLSSLYSPPGWLSWVAIARMREAIETEDQHRAFKNSILGETWVQRGEAPPWESIFERRESWSPEALPAEVLLLTAGLDVQGDRIEVRVWGWGRRAQRWLVATAIMLGDPARAETWQGVDQLLASAWPSELGGMLQIARIGVDTGYAAEDVYGWARRYSPGLVMLIKGDARQLGAIGARRAAEVTSQGKARKFGVHIWPVNTAPLKSKLYGALRLPAPKDGESYPSGWVHLPNWCSEEEVRQLTAEHLVRTIGRGGVPKFEWQLPPGRRNEALDCACYAHAAAITLGVDRWGEQRWAALERSLTRGGAAQRQAVHTVVDGDEDAVMSDEGEEEQADIETGSAPAESAQEEVVSPEVRIETSRTVVMGRAPAAVRPGAMGPPPRKRRVLMSTYVL